MDYILLYTIEEIWNKFHVKPTYTECSSIDFIIGWDHYEINAFKYKDSYCLRFYNILNKSREMYFVQDLKKNINLMIKRISPNKIF
jgi:hypothetical protein